MVRLGLTLSLMVISVPLGTVAPDVRMSCPVILSLLIGRNHRATLILRLLIALDASGLRVGRLDVGVESEIALESVVGAFVATSPKAFE